MRLRLPFAITIVVLAETLSLASPSPIIREAQAAARYTIEGFVVDAAIVWSVFVLTVVLVAGILSAARRLLVARMPPAPVELPVHRRTALAASGRTSRAVART